MSSSEEMELTNQKLIKRFKEDTRFKVSIQALIETFKDTKLKRTNEDKIFFILSVLNGSGIIKILDDFEEEDFFNF